MFYYWFVILVLLSEPNNCKMLTNNQAPELQNVPLAPSSTEWTQHISNLATEVKSELEKKGISQGDLGLSKIDINDRSESEQFQSQLNQKGGDIKIMTTSAKQTRFQQAIASGKCMQQRSGESIFSSYG